MNTDKLKSEAVKSFCESPYWKDTYEKANDLAKRYYQVIFAISISALADGGIKNIAPELNDELDSIYDSLDEESWKYILEHTSGPSKLGLGRVMKSRMASKRKQI